MSKDARFLYVALLAACFFSLGASYRTQNFIVQADSPQLAREIGDAAEVYRRDLAIEWLGKELPPWTDICPITAQVSPQLGAGGATSFYFSQARPHGWSMTLQGSRERVLDSVLPHEITHTIFATHFGQPLPRWADEGACTTVEHESERSRQQKFLIEFLMTNRGIAFSDMFQMREYPDDILPLYSQGYSLARFLIAQGGKQKFVNYVGDGMRSSNWTATTQKHYRYESLSQLQQTWLTWVKRGSPTQPDALVAIQPQPRAENSPPPATPPTRFAIATTADESGSYLATSEDSWYARERDAVHGKVSQASRTEPLAENSRAETSQTDVQPLTRSSVTRPQGISRPQQTTLPPLEPVPSVAPIREASGSPTTWAPTVRLY